MEQSLLSKAPSTRRALFRKLCLFAGKACCASLYSCPNDVGFQQAKLILVSVVTRQASLRQLSELSQVQYNNMDNRKKQIKIALWWLCIVITMCGNLSTERQRKLWCKKWLQRRVALGSHAPILKELKQSSAIDFTNFMRMDPNTLYNLLAKVEPYNSILL